MWTKDGKLVDPHTEGAERHVIGNADVSESGLAYLTVNETTYDGLTDILIREDLMGFSFDDTHPDFPDELPVRFTPRPVYPFKMFRNPHKDIIYRDPPPALNLREVQDRLMKEHAFEEELHSGRIREELLRKINPPIHPAALPNCTCPWNNGFKVKGHRIACPYLKGHHDPEDDCGEHGHNNKE